MRIKSIKNIDNNYKINFGAKLKISGYVEDIPEDLKQSWKEKINQIGRDSDVINLHFLLPSSYQSKFNDGKDVLYRMERDIYGFIKLGDFNGLKKDLIGYKKIIRHQLPENEFLRKSFELTKKCVDKYINKLQKRIKK